MSNICEYGDLIAFHPGLYLKDVAESSDLEKALLAEKLQMTTEELDRFFDGEIPVTEKTAEKISAVTGTSKELWTNLQEAYNEKMTEILEAMEEEL